MQVNSEIVLKIQELQKQLNKKVVIGVESAAVLYGLSAGNIFPLTYVSSASVSKDTDSDSGKVVTFRQGSNLGAVRTPEHEEVVAPYDWNPTLVVFAGVNVTSPEQTIIDLLKLNRDPQTIIEAMSYYYFSMDNPESWGSLRELARSNGVLDLFDSFAVDALDQASY